MVGAVEDGGGVAVEVAVEAASRNQNKRAPGVVPNIRIFRLASGKDAQCIISSGNKVISVQSQRLAHGKMCTLQGQTNETGTSP